MFKALVDSPYMPSRLLDHLGRRVLLLDGAMGSTLQSMPLTVDGDYLGRENCVDVLVRTRPELIQQIHESYLAAGSDAVETDTFGANQLVFAEFDEELVSWTYDLNKEAAEIARAACEAHATADKPRFVFGSMGPGTKLLTLGQVPWERMLESYAEQARGLVDGGADALLIETCQDLLQIKCAINACLKALDDRGKTPQDVPIMVSVTVETTGTMLLGAEIAAAATALRGYPIASLGLNCATGPVEMTEHVEWLSRHWDRAISIVPNAGLPVLVEGQTSFPLEPQPMADAVRRFVEELGVAVIGGCCGTTPEHIAALAKIAEGLAPTTRSPEPIAACTSSYGPVEYRQENSFLNVGERLNASGSRAFKRMLEAEDWDGMVSLAREQSREGGNVLDINVDYAGRDNAADMAEIVKRLVRQVNAPLMIDSTQLATLEAGLKHAPGKCLINSANFEEGDEKFDAICRLATTYGAGLVIGSIDEDPESAMARTAERKFAIAKRGLERAVEVHGLAAEDVMFDPLVLPISTGMDSDRRSALELVEGTRRISEAFPQCQITCGLSNVSFGLRPPARVVLNSVFLDELVKAGMTSAILHSAKILPLARIDPEHVEAALDLIYDRRAESAGGTGLPEGVEDESFDPLGRFIDLFKDVSTADEAAEAVERTLEEQLRHHIIDGEKRGLEECLETARETYEPLDIINDHLLDGMKTVGELFASGRMQLPFVLQSAEVMKKAVGHLEQYMDRKEGETRGTIVLATVKGDVHDIGKNLVDIILSNNGFEVVNIGIKQPLSAMVEAVEKHKAHALGMSGLLVKSVMIMEENLQEMNRLGLAVPVLLGGAALARHYAESHLRGVYDGPLYYGKDAFDGLRICEHLVAGRIGEIDAEIDARLEKRAAAEEVVAKAKAAKETEASAAEDVAAVEAAAGGTATATSTAASGTGTVAADAGVAVTANGTVNGTANGTVDGRSNRTAAPAAPATCGAGDGSEPDRSDVRRDVPVPKAPFFGSRVVEGLPLEEVYPFINTVALFRGQWGFKKGGDDEKDYQRKIEDVAEPTLERLKAEAIAEGWLAPRVVYGYHPCASDGDDLVVFDAEDHDREIERFSFPRQTKRQRLCIADFFRPIDAGERDVLGLHCVTVGDDASKRARELFEANEYQQYLYVHGFGVETAEALAELWHKRMRAELGIGGEDSPRIRDLFTQKYRGSRYSFGYPACPEMSDQEKLFRLLRPERIGCTLTENWQIDPEQSTSAILVHHPQAKYFAL